MGWRVALVAGLLVCFGCGDTGSDGTRSAGTADAPGSQTWPDPDADAADCLIAYPKDLRQQPYAFDGTVTAVHIGEYDERNGLPPVRIAVAINELFRGQNVEDEIVLRTEEQGPSG